MNDAAPLAPTRHRLDVAAFYRMAEVGIIGARDRIELIDGELIDMAPIGEDHAGTTNLIAEVFVLACQGRATISVQNPVMLGPFDMPQPDFAVLRRRADFYRTKHAEPGDVLLLVEVADTSLRFDRTVKLGRYAQAGIAEYWIVDLPGRAVIVHRQPSSEGYAEIAPLPLGNRIALAAAPEIVIDLAPLFA